MRKFLNQRQLNLVTALCTALILSSTSASSESFDSIFGEFADDHQMDSLLRKESRKAGKAPVSPLESEILLSTASLKRMDKAIDRLESIVRKGGWPTIASKGTRIKSGERSPEVDDIKKQLVKRGDLPASRFNLMNSFDDDLEDAILKFQKRHGIRQSGYVDRRTRLALAITANKRLGQMRLNRQRLSKAIKQMKGDDKYVMVNVPDYSLQAVENNRIALTSRVIVGRNDRQTPDIYAKIEAVNFNPFWHVPDSLVRKDIIPNQLKDPNFMKENFIKVFKDYSSGPISPSKVNWRSAEARRYKYRQDPGDHNALGLIRIQMPNRHIVYLHDTPTKKLYGLRGRAYSSGCVRVEKIRDLSAWILKEKKGWDRSKIDDVIKAGKLKSPGLKKHIPVQFIYVTSWVDGKNNIHFREDIYDRDKGLKRYASKSEKVKDGNRLSP